MIFRFLMVSCFACVFQLGIYAQSSCSCGVGSGGCTASQTCPSPQIAICTCSATGCSSYCNGGDPPEGFSSNLEALSNAKDGKEFNSILSRAAGKKIVFTPSSKSFTFDTDSSRKFQNGRIEMLEYLSNFGTVKVNGRDLKFWLDTRNDLLTGIEIAICSGGATVKSMLTELSFYTGKNYRVIAGDELTPVTQQLKGNGIQQILDKISTSYKVTIISD